MRIPDWLLARTGVYSSETEAPRAVLAVIFETIGLLVLLGFGGVFGWLGYPGVAVVYWVYGGLLIVNVAIGLIWGKIHIARFNALVLTMVMPFVLMFVFGGFTP
jgi:hypothetical protein